MSLTRTLLIAGVAATVIAGIATAAALNTHALTVRLPGGGIERIVYTGDVAPRVVVAPAAAPIVWAAGPGFDDTAFAAMDQISAQMDREMAAMLRQAEAIESTGLAGAGPLTVASTADLPPGARSYSFVSTTSGAGVCSRSVEITATGDGREPRVVSHSSGSCGTSAAPPVSRSLDTASAPTPDRTRFTQASFHSRSSNSSGMGPT